MLRTPSQVTGDQARTIMESSIPLSWVSRRLPDDYGLDYEIEVFEGSQSTNCFFHAQLKGTESLVVRGENAVLEFSVQHLKDYIRQVLPVVLLLVDVPKKQTYWLLVDAAVDALSRSRSGWQDQKTVTVEFPLVNVLPDSSKQLADAVEAVTDSIRGFSESYLVFGADDYCIARSWRWQHLKAFEVSLDVYLPYDRPRPSTIACFCTETSRPDGGRWFEAVLQLGLMPSAEGPQLVARDCLARPIVEYVGPHLAISTWQKVSASVGGDVLSLCSEGLVCTHKVASPPPTGPVFMIGIKPTASGIANGLEGLLKRIRITDLTRCVDTATWVFPRFDPCADLSGHGTHLSFPLGHYSDRRSTNDPLYVPLDGV